MSAVFYTNTDINYYVSQNGEKTKRTTIPTFVLTVVQHSDTGFLKFTTTEKKTEVKREWLIAVSKCDDVHR